MDSDFPMPTLDLTRDFDKSRALFPVTQTQAYLMNAAQSPLNTRSRAAIEAYLEMSAVNLDARPSVREPIRVLLSGLLGGKPLDYAVTTSTGTGISTVAAGFAWQSGDNVVQPAGEHFDELGRGVEEGQSNVRPASEDAVAMLKQVVSPGYHRHRMPQELMVLQGGQSGLFSSTSGNVSLGGGFADAPAAAPVAPVQMDNRAKAKMQGYEGEACGDCGNYTLVRNGTCMKCNTCGGTSGCS